MPQSEAIRLINEANPNAQYVTLQGFEALKSVANGQSTKLIIPSDIQNVAGLFASMKEVVTEDKNTRTVSNQKQKNG